MRWRGVFTTDRELVIRSWDDELATATGISQEEAIGRELGKLFPDIAERGLLEKFQQVIDSGAVVTLAPAFHHYLIACPPRLPNSRFTYMEQWVILAPLRRGEEVVGVMVSLEDVTDRGEGKGEISGKDTLISSLGEKDWKLRKKALEELSRDASYETIKRMIETIRYHLNDLSVLNSILQILAVSETDTGPYLEALLGDPDAELRIYAALLLGERREKRYVHSLIKALKDPDANVRFHTIEALGKMKASEATDALMEIVETRDFFLTFPALNALAEIGVRDVVERITPFLSDPILCHPAIEALGKLGDEKTVFPLARALQNQAIPVSSVARALETIYERYEREFGEGDYIGELAQQSISREGIERLVGALEEVAESDLRPLVRVLGWLKGEEVERAMIRLLGKPELREEVIRALTRYGRQVVPLIARQLKIEDVETRKAAVIALGRIGDPQSVPALIEALLDVPEVVVCAAGALAKIGDRRAFHPLLELMGHPLTAVRQAVIGALNSIGHPEMSEEMALLLQSPDPRVRESAVRVAGYFGYENCRELLLAMADDEVENVRRVVVEHLPYLEDKRVPGILVRKVREDTATVRAAAAKAMSMIPSPETEKNLLEATSDRDPWVRYFAIQALGQLGVHEALPIAIDLITNDPAGQVKIAAVRTVGMLGGMEGLEVLANTLQSADEDLAEETIAALGKMNHPRVREILHAIIRSGEKRLRIRAIEALPRHIDASSLELLIWRILSGDKEERQVAIDTLCSSGLPEAIKSILYVAKEPSIRELAVSALARRGEALFKTLVEILPKADGEEKKILCAVLMRIRSDRATEVLLAMLEDEDSTVRLTAVQSLIRIGSLKGEHVLRRLAASDPSPDVREAAARVLY